MKYCLIILIIISLTNSSFGQIVSRFANETPTDFVKRFQPENSNLTHKVIDANWNSKPVIVAFYEQTYKLSKKQDPDQQEYQRIISVIYISTGGYEYKKLLIDTFDTEGGDPNIETVFFANADKDISKELVIIVSWEQKHYDVNGTDYGTFIYDNVSPNVQFRLPFLKNISTRLDGGCDCAWRDGKSRKAKFKTAKDIRRELVKLGY